MLVEDLHELEEASGVLRGRGLELLHELGFLLRRDQLLSGRKPERCTARVVGQVALAVPDVRAREDLEEAGQVAPSALLVRKRPRGAIGRRNCTGVRPSAIVSVVTVKLAMSPFVVSHAAMVG